jgi:hypothetical protein
MRCPLAVPGRGGYSTPYNYNVANASAREEALERLARGDWPAASVVNCLFGTWAAARVTAAEAGSVGKPATVGDVAVGQQLDLAA